LALGYEEITELQIEARLRSSDTDWEDGAMTTHAGARSEF
jgi:hypothetical protein